jgi:hypothetical protein
VHRHHLTHGLDLDDQRVTNKVVGPPKANYHSLVPHIAGWLPSEQDPAKPELDSQGFLIDAFQEPRAEVTVNFYPGSDDATSEVINPLARLRKTPLAFLASWRFST